MKKYILILSSLLLVNVLNAQTISDNCLGPTENENIDMLIENDYNINYSMEETEKTYLIKIDMPGFKKEVTSLKINNNNILIISSERNSIKGIEPFLMKIKFKEKINEKYRVAKLENNILFLDLPKIIK